MEQNYNSDYSNDNSYEQPERFSMFDAWVEALTQPNVEAYQGLAKATNANTKTAVLWMAISLVIGLIIASIIISIVGVSMFSGLSSMYAEETGMNMPDAAIGAGSMLGYLFCGVPAGVVFGILVFLLSTAIYSGLANLFGGDGTYDSLAFVLASFSAPISLVSTFLSVVPFIGRPISTLLGLYSLYLTILAIRAVKKLTWGKAALVYFIPGIILFILSICIIVVFISQISGMSNY